MKPHLKVFKELTDRLRAHGFAKRGNSWWQRKRGFTWQRIHIHKFTFAESFRVHSTIHIAGVEDEAETLTGMSSNDGWSEKRWFGIPVRRYRFNYDEEDTQSISKCAAELGDYIENCVIPWFSSWENAETLFGSSKSPLRDSQKEVLREMKQHSNKVHPQV